MLYPLPYIRSLPHSQFYCHFVFSMKSDWIGCLVFFVVLCTYNGANAYCHLIGRDGENILSSCIDQSDTTIHLLQYMHTKQQRWSSIRFVPVTTIQSHFFFKNEFTIKPQKFTPSRSKLFPLKVKKKCN